MLVKKLMANLGILSMMQQNSWSQNLRTEKFCASIELQVCFPVLGNVYLVSLGLSLGRSPSQHNYFHIYLVSLGLSLGRSPSQHICKVASLVLATSFARPMNSASS